MKTPDEIKKGLECCGRILELDSSCDGCPYLTNHALYNCEGGMEQDALAYITELEQRLAQVEQERDAAVRDMENYAGYGAICKRFDNDCPHVVEGCPLWPSDCEDYEWRGVCEENSKEGETNEGAT